MTMSYLLPGTVGTLISCAFFLGLAVFIFLQRGHAATLRRLVFVAIGLVIWGLFPVLTIPLDFLLNFLDYGSVPWTVANLLDRTVGGIGYFIGTGLVIVGMTLVAKDLALGVEDEPLDD